MSKYKELILETLSRTQIKSTNEVLNEVQKKTNKVINWHLLYRVLIELSIKGEIEKLESKAGFFWRRR